MKRADNVRAAHKLDAITHYLLKAFPGAAILSHRENGEDYLLTVCSAALDDDHLLRIAKTFLNEAHPAVEDLPRLFDHLELARVLRERGEYRLGRGTVTTIKD